MTSRSDQVGALVEQVAAICGLAVSTITVTDETKTGCRLTRNGIDLMVNPSVNEDISNRNRFGVCGNITLSEVDTIVACYVTTRAQDFLLKDWQQAISYSSEITENAQRYLQDSIDEMASYARMIAKIPFAQQKLDAYLSRASAHAMSSAPLHLQLMRTLRLYLFETDPQIVVSPFITDELGITKDVAPLVVELKTIIANQDLSYAKRHAEAGRILMPSFLRMLMIDQASLGYYELMHLYDNEQSYGASKDALDDDNIFRQEDDATTRAMNALETINEGNIDQLIADNNEPAIIESDLPTLKLPNITEQRHNMSFNAVSSGDYKRAAERWRSSIQETADILVNIANPQEELSIPRYSTKLAHYGSRMHPSQIINAQIQLITGQSKAIWQKVKRETRPQSLEFKGLDAYLLLDISFSMAGEAADNAAIMGMCLMEALELAVEKTNSTPARGEVDIRTQLLAFGEGWAELTPLETTHSAERKIFAFAQLSNPTSGQTQITSALQYIQKRARAEASRDILCLVVGDGLFADGLQARKCTMSMPDNVYLAHINIGDYSGLPLSNNFETISNPLVLPEKLRSVLARHLSSR